MQSTRRRCMPSPALSGRSWRNAEWRKDFGGPAKPSLKLEQRHRLLRVVELASDGGSSPVAGDVAADVSGRHARLGAECRDDANVQVLSADSLRPVGKQQVDPFGGLAVAYGGLRWPDGLPGGDGVPHDRVDRFSERGAGLVHRDVQQADRILVQRLVGVAGQGDVFALPADASDP